MRGRKSGPAMAGPPTTALGGRHSENHTFAHKLAIIAHICTKFDTEADNWVPQLRLPSKFT